MKSAPWRWGACCAGWATRVSVAHHFREALPILDEKPGLLITDIVMPHSVNGLALGRMARMRNPRMRLVYVTGYDIRGLEHEMLGPLLRKPVAEDRLLATVAAQLSVH